VKLTIHDNFHNGTSLRDTGDEDSDETRPSSPPGHVENSPGVHPPGSTCHTIGSSSLSCTELAKGIGVERNQDNGILEVVSNRLNDKVKDEGGVVESESPEEEKHTEVESNVGEVLDTDFESRDDRDLCVEGSGNKTEG
jgi:hypothetical protein